MCLKTLRNGCLITLKKIPKQPPELFCKKAVLLKTSQYSQDNILIAKFLRAPILKNICKRLLLKMWL